MADPLSPEELIRRAMRLKADRSSVDAHRQEVADYIMPSREFQGTSTPGSKRTAKIFHTGPVMRAEQLAGAHHGLQTSPALRWMAVKPDIPDANQDQEIRGFFDHATEQLNNVFNSPRAKFSLSAHEGYLDSAAFGEKVMFIHDGGMRGPRFEAMPLAECYLAENDEGDLDTLFRIYKMRAQLVCENERWKDSVPERRRVECERNPDAMWDVIHFAGPDPRSNVVDIQGRKRYVCIYLLVQDKLQLGKTEMYQERPFVASRWAKRSGETTGFGPGMNALPDVRGLNKLEEEHLRGVMLKTRPPLMLPEDGFLSAVRQSPGAFNYYRTDGVQGNIADRVGPLITGDMPEVAAEKIANYEARIAECFYVSWMQLPFRPNMTATEFSQRRDEMLRLMSPMVARDQTESLGPTIERTFAIMWRNGQLGRAPTSLSGMKWRIEYRSPLDIAQKSLDAQSIMQWVASLTQLAAADPTVLDVMNADEAAKELGEKLGAPTNIIRTDAVVAQLREARAQRDQMMQQAAAAESITKSLQQGGAGAASLADAAMSSQGLAA